MATDQRTKDHRLTLKEIAKDPAAALSKVELDLGVEPGTLLKDMEHMTSKNEVPRCLRCTRCDQPLGAEDEIERLTRQWEVAEVGRVYAENERLRTALGHIARKAMTQGRRHTAQLAREVLRPADETAACQYCSVQGTFADIPPCPIHGGT